METLYERCAGLDIGKDEVVACVRAPDGGGGRRVEVRTFGTFTRQLEALAAWLADAGVTTVVMEATGQYWKPVWYVLEERDLELLLVNARHVKILPGRKTDVKDAEWLAQLLECGLVHGSFVPEPVFRQLRDLTRDRKRYVDEVARESLRVQKILEDTGLKLSSVVTDTLGKTGRHILEALIAGERDPAVLADMALGRARRKIPQLERALVGHFSDHHAFMLRGHLDHIDYLEGLIARLDERVDEVMAPFASQRDRLQTIPGVGKRAAEVIIAEIGVDMSRFPTAAHLASWAGMCPGNNESAGKHLSGRTRKGDPWLSGLLTQCGWAARRTKNTRLAARFWRIARTRGEEKAALATGHTILVIAWHILSSPDAVYTELGVDYFTPRRNPKKEQERLIARLQALGLEVTVTEAA